MPTDVRKELEETLGEVEWSLLVGHAARDGIIIVALNLELLEVGVKIAQDDAATVNAWVDTGQLSKPTREQLSAWSEDPKRKFRSLVVQPYVLIQEIVH